MLCRATGRAEELTVVAGFSCEQVGDANTGAVNAATPVFTNDQIAYQLTNGYWGGSDRSFNVGVGGSISVNITALTSAGQNLARQALELWSDTTGLSFTFTGGGAQITFDDADVWSAWNWSSTSGGNINFSNVNVGASWVGYYGTGINTYSLQTYVHEIGHALGLGHGGNYNGNATYGTDNHYANDSWQATVMSYFNQAENTYISASYTYAITPMVADVIAIRNLYGTTGTTRTGNTTYGDNANSGDIMQTISSMSSYISFTIVDDGGTDTLDFSSYSGSQTIDLREEGISSVRGYTGNVIIARDTVIENAIGGSGNDTIIGNGASNILRGGLGSDTLNGNGGSDWAYYDTSSSAININLSDSASESGGHAAGDTLISIERIHGSLYNDVIVGGRTTSYISGWWGNDTLTGGSQAETLHGGAGNDILRSSGGGDTLNGGNGTDWAYYSASDSAVNINLSNNTPESGGGAAGDTLISIERILGSAFNDTIIGSTVVNYISGYLGNDVLTGSRNAETLHGGSHNDILRSSGGGDVLNGGSGTDWAYYNASDSAVSVDLSDGSVESGGGAQGDTLISIERILGSQYNDTLIGTSITNYLSGWLGNDFLEGGSGNETLHGGSGYDILRGSTGSDTLNGGNGTDWAYYNNSTSAVTVNLSDGASESGGYAQGDTLISIERVLGSQFNDTLIGGSITNALSGWLGNDTIVGGNNAEKLDGGSGNDTLTGNNGDDILIGGLGNDNLTGGLGSDTFLFNETGYNDTITDFQDTIDLIEISAGANSFSDLAVSDSSGDALISYSGGSILLENFNHALLSSSDFNFV